MVFISRHDLFSQYGLKPVVSTVPPSKEGRKTTFIVVLGSINPIIRAKRVDKSIEVYCNSIQRVEDMYEEYGTHECTYLLFSGGIAPNEQTVAKIKVGEKPEAELMKEYAVFRGVDPKVIMLEDKSINTYQNIEFVHTFLALNSLTILDKRRDNICLKIVTSSVHMPRVKLMVEYFMLARNIEYIESDDVPTKEEIERERYLTNAFREFVEHGKELPKKKFALKL